MLYELISAELRPIQVELKLSPIVRGLDTFSLTSRHPQPRQDGSVDPSWKGP